MRVTQYSVLLLMLSLLGGCSLLQAGKLYAPETFGLVPIAPNVYVEASADEATKAVLREAMIKAELAITKAYGDAQALPVVNACVTEHCFWSFGGRMAIAKVYGSRILLSPRGLNWHFIAHEWSHAELSARLKFSAWKRMPQWFDEGVAVAISEAPEHSEEHWQFLVDSNIPRPTREELHGLKSLEQWLSAASRYADNKNAERRAQGKPEHHILYAAAGHEIRPWVAAAGSRGLLEFIEKLNAGEAFESAYQPANKALQGTPRLSATRP